MQERSRSKCRGEAVEHRGRKALDGSLDLQGTAPGREGTACSRAGGCEGSLTSLGANSFGEIAAENTPSIASQASLPSQPFCIGRRRRMNRRPVGGDKFSVAWF